MFVSNNNNGVIITKKKQYTSSANYKTTGYGPSICLMADKNRFYTPNHDEIESNFINEMDLLISYQNHFNDDNADYDIHNTHKSSTYVNNSYTAGDHRFKWRQQENKQIINLAEINPDPSFETYTLSSSGGYVKYNYNSVYETYGNPIINISKSAPYTKASTGTYCTTTVKYYNNDYFPASLGCAILFSASEIPSAQFAVGIKGGTGGSMYNFNGKLYNSNDTEHLKNLGNGIYLFYDTVIDNLNFRTGINAKRQDSENNDILYFTPPVIAGDLSFELYDGGTLAKETRNKGSFKNFEYISVRTFLQFGQPNPDDVIRIKPQTASISPRYNPSAVSQFKKDSQKWCFHSKTPYSNTIPGYNESYGYDGMSITDATEVVNWGDTKYITGMAGACTNNHDLTAIPDSWGNWENLKTTDAMFINCDSLTTIPHTWAGLNSVSSTAGMFRSCSSLKSIPTSWEGLDNLERAYDMFYNCSSLSEINLSDLLTKAPKLKNIARMFLGTKINDKDGVSAFIDACRANSYLSAVSAHSACFYNTPVSAYFNVADYPDWFNETIA